MGDTGNIIIQAAPHPYLLPGLILSILIPIFLYNLFTFIRDKVRAPKIKRAIGMIVEGYDKLCDNKQPIMVDGKALDGSFITDQIEKNEEEIERIEASSPKQQEKEKKRLEKERKREEKRLAKEAKRAAKAPKPRNDVESEDEAINELFAVTDEMDTATDLFYTFDDEETKLSELNQKTPQMIREEKKAAKLAAKREAEEKRRQQKEQKRAKKKKQQDTANNLSLFD